MNKPEKLIDRQALPTHQAVHDEQASHWLWSSWQWRYIVMFSIDTAHNEMCKKRYLVGN